MKARARKKERLGRLGLGLACHGRTGVGEAKIDR